MARFAVADDGRSRVAGDAVRVGDDLHAGHFPAEQDAQCPQADEGGRLDRFHVFLLTFCKGVAAEMDGVALVDVQPGELGVRVREDPPLPGRVFQQYVAEDGLTLGQFFAAVKLLVNAQNAIALHGAPLLLLPIIRRRGGSVNCCLTGSAAG